MRSLAANFLLALLLFGGVFWYFFSREQADIATLAQRYGAAAASETAPASSPESAGPAISTTPAPQPGS